MTNKIIRYCSLAMFTFVSFSCSEIYKESEIRKSINSEWLGKQIQFPRELMILKRDELHPIYDFESSHSDKNKIVSIVDATCPSCILGQLNRTDSLFHTLIDRDKSVLIFILNVNKYDSASFFVSIQPLINARGIILWDSNYNFETINDIFTENIVSRTFLLNSKNEILLIGNPLFESKLLSKYKNSINSI